MRFTWLFPPLILLAVAGIIVAQGHPQPNGLPLINGTWSGALSFKLYEQQDGAGRPDKGKQAIVMDITQRADVIDIGLTVFTGSGPRLLNFTGRHGNGHFWGTSTDEGVLVMTGHVKKDKLKGIMLGGNLPEAVEVKLKASRGGN